MNAFDKIIGYAGIKKELAQLSDTIKHVDAYRKLGVSTPRGLLLYGEPGVGKSLMASVLIEESGRTAYICRKDTPDGDFIKEIKATFDRAMKNAPSIVYLDDMDKFANGDERHPDAEEYVTVQSCIDEAKGREVFVLATANNIRCLPRSLRRAGRFDRTIEVPAPEGKDAEAIIAHYLGEKKFVQDVDAQTIARLLNGKSCAELETVINEAGVYAGFQRAEAITMEHFMDAFLGLVYHMSQDDDDEDDDYYSPALGDGSRIFNLIVYHEVGHAVVSEVLAPGSVTLVCVRKGAGRGGFTHYYNDEKLTPLNWNMSRLISALGGMAAVEQVFGIQDCGSRGDLDQAFEFAHDMVGSYCFSGFQFHSQGYQDSDTLTALREQAAATEVERCYRKAKEVLAKNRPFVEKLAEALAEKLVLSLVDIRSIKAKCAIAPVAVG